MDDLERRLGLLTEDFFPPTPDVATAVLARLSPRRRAGPRLALVPAFALAVALGVLSFSPQARSLVTSVLRLDGATIERVPELEIDLERLRPLPLGERVELREAQRRLGFKALVPEGYDAVYLGYRPSGGAVTFVWGPPFRPRLLLTEFVGQTEQDFIYKQAGPGTTVRELELGGEPALWISGAPHRVYYRYGDLIDEEEIYLAGDVLIWRAGPVSLRLEGASLGEALALTRALSGD